MCKIKLDYNQLVFKELFTVDELSPTGLRYANDNSSFANGKKFKNEVAGFLRETAKSKVWVVKIKNKSYVVHRIIWYLHFGYIPEDKVIDHKDGNSLNNLLDNLRLTTQKLNNTNHRKQKNNTSGKTGVYFDKLTSKWRASWNDGKRQRSKRFDSFEDACRYRDLQISNLQIYTERHGI